MAQFGHVQRKVGNLEEARKAYVESAKLYHSWWDIDLAVNGQQHKVIWMKKKPKQKRA